MCRSTEGSAHGRGGPEGGAISGVFVVLDPGPAGGAGGVVGVVGVVGSKGGGTGGEAGVGEVGLAKGRAGVALSSTRVRTLPGPSL